MPAGPAIRRFAREVGVDLATVQGSGPGGRVTREDVLQVVRQASQAVHRDSVPAPIAPPSAAPSGTPSSDAWGPVSLEPLTRIRKTIAAKMHESWTTVPRVTNFDDVDITELEKMRQASKADYLEAGIKLTSMPFVVKAVAMALRNHPLLNASLDLDQNQIVYKQYVSIGIAVDSERGLVVPALRNADRMTIADTAKELAAVAQKVRNNQFTLDDMRARPLRSAIWARSVEPIPPRSSTSPRSPSCWWAQPQDAGGHRGSRGRAADDAPEPLV